MTKRAEEKAKERNSCTRKRKPEEKEISDNNKKSKKKIRKLRYSKVEDDWGMIGNEIKDMEEREVARARFLHVDRSWAKVGTTQTKIRAWSKLEVMARNIIINYLEQANTDAEKRKTERNEFIKEEAASWLESKEAREEVAMMAGSQESR